MMTETTRRIQGERNKGRKIREELKEKMKV
jgi:hypothetical protein